MIIKDGGNRTPVVGPPPLPKVPEPATSSFRGFRNLMSGPATTRPDPNAQAALVAAQNLVTQSRPSTNGGGGAAAANAQFLMGLPIPAPRQLPANALEAQMAAAQSRVSNDFANQLQGMGSNMNSPSAAIEAARWQQMMPAPAQYLPTVTQPGPVAATPAPAAPSWGLPQATPAIIPPLSTTARGLWDVIQKVAAAYPYAVANNGQGLEQVPLPAVMGGGIPVPAPAPFISRPSTSAWDNQPAPGVVAPTIPAVPPNVAAWLQNAFSNASQMIDSYSQPASPISMQMGQQLGQMIQRPMTSSWDNQPVPVPAPFGFQGVGGGPNIDPTTVPAASVVPQQSIQRPMTSAWDNQPAPAATTPYLPMITQPGLVPAPAPAAPGLAGILGALGSIPPGIAAQLPAMYRQIIGGATTAAPAATAAQSAVAPFIGPQRTDNYGVPTPAQQANWPVGVDPQTGVVDDWRQPAGPPADAATGPTRQQLRPQDGIETDSAYLTRILSALSGEFIDLKTVNLDDLMAAFNAESGMPSSFTNWMQKNAAKLPGLLGAAEDEPLPAPAAGAPQGPPPQGPPPPSGGGGGGGGGSAAPAVAATDFDLIPEYYRLGFAAAFGDLANYYTEALGGSKQAESDYQSFIVLFSQLTGRYPQPDEVGRHWAEFKLYAARTGKPVKFSDFLNWLRRRLSKAAPAPDVSYLNLTEV